MILLHVNPTDFNLWTKEYKGKLIKNFLQEAEFPYS